MRLYSLHLVNFQGIRDARFDFNGLDANVYGDNATGKTTMFNAVTWLLFDKPSTGAKNFTPKTKGLDGDVHYLEHSVEACFTLDDGRYLTLKKVYKEDYKKRRGSAVEEFVGHVVEYYTDNVPIREKEYVASLNNYIGPEEQIKMLMMPDYFSEMVPWDTRRRILLEMCGDIADSDVIQGNPDLNDLLKVLSVPGASGKYYSVDEYKKIASASCVKINKDIQAIPARIDEAKKAMPNVTGLVLSNIENEIAKIETTIGEKESRKQQILSGDATVLETRRQISELQTKLAEDRAAYAERNANANDGAYEELKKHKDDLLRVRNNHSELKASLNNAQLKRSLMDEKRGQLLADYERISAEQWTGSEICPTCGQPLPEDEVSRAMEQFNLNKSKRLEEINLKGQQTCSAKMIADLDLQISNLTQNIKTAESSIFDYESLITDTQNNLKLPAPFEDTDAYIRAMSTINSLRQNENEAGSLVSKQIAILESEITALRGRISALSSDKSKLTLSEQQVQRIKELSDSEKNLSKQYESLQRGIYLCEEFIKTKVSMLTDRINGKFASVRFRLFINHISGGLKEDCEVMVPAEGRMVPYSFANNAARINAGLEIINALASHWNTSVPVFVDNAESVTQLQDIDSQLIRLVVSEQDKSLRMEMAV